MSNVKIRPLQPHPYSLQQPGQPRRGDGAKTAQQVVGVEFHFFVHGKIKYAVFTTLVKSLRNMS